MQLFYSTHIVEGHLYFDDEESRHILKSLRMKVGDQLSVVDGKGQIFQGRLASLKPLAARILSSEFIESPSPVLHIAIAPTKNLSRWDWFLEKSTELGVSRITPLQCLRSERARIKSDRANRIIKSAMKQSGRAYLPHLDPMTSFQTVVAMASADSVKLIAHCQGRAPLVEKNVFKHASSTVLIGPEGDFTTEEIEAAESAGFKAISLGNYRLRTETAGVYICALSNSMQLQ